MKFYQNQYKLQNQLFIYLAEYSHFDLSDPVHDDLQEKAECDASFAPQRM